MTLRQNQERKDADQLAKLVGKTFTIKDLEAELNCSGSAAYYRAKRWEDAGLICKIGARKIKPWLHGAVYALTDAGRDLAVPPENIFS